MEQIHSIYSKTYNFVYLRAKNILKKEEDIQNLMKEVYLQAVAKNVQEENMYEFLGKQTYILGCQKYRKKKVREAERIELEAREYRMAKSIDKDMTQQVIVDTLEQLPDMYQATLYAFYYDHMSIKEISNVMGYGTGAIINRLNYIHKYLSKALEMHQENIKTKIQFSVEAVSGALRLWSAKNMLNVGMAQNVYSGICRELGIDAELVCEEGVLAGVEKKIVACDGDEVDAIIAALEIGGNKANINKKQATILGVIIGILAVLATVIVLIVSGIDSKKNTEVPKNDAEVEESIENENGAEEIPETDIGNDESVEEEIEEEVESNDAESEYILPNSDTVLLTREDLAGLSAEELRLARNEIFARYGTIFGVEDLESYFTSKSWYNPRITFDDFNENVEMNQIEEANLALILQMEEEVAQ